MSNPEIHLSGPDELRSLTILWEGVSECGPSGSIPGLCNAHFYVEARGDRLVCKSLR